MPSVLVLAAVADEFNELARRLHNPLKTEEMGRTKWVGQIGGHRVCLVETGPGLINAAMTLTATVLNEKPELVIQTGCAGAFPTTGLSNGDIGVATEEVDAQLGIEGKIGEDVPDLLPFPILKKGALEIQNRYLLDQDLAQKALQTLKKAFSQKNVSVMAGPFVSVVTVTATDKRAKSLYAAYQGIMENMEGAASAHVCLCYNIPYLEIRAVSNRVGHRDTSIWALPLAFERAGEAVAHVIKAF